MTMRSEIRIDFSFSANPVYLGFEYPVSKRCVDTQYGLFANVAINEGELLFRIEGERTSYPTRYSVQIDENVHIDIGAGCLPDEFIKKYPWRFMNHSCEPNTVIYGQEVFAKRSILPLEEVTYNYNTTEYEMAEPFICRCPSSGCLRLIRGFKYLSVPERELLRPWLAPHILRIWESEFLFMNSSISSASDETH